MAEENKNEKKVSVTKLEVPIQLVLTLFSSLVIAVSGYFTSMFNGEKRDLENNYNLNKRIDKTEETLEIHEFRLKENENKIYDLKNKNNE